MKNLIISIAMSLFAVSNCFAHSSDFNNPSVMELKKEIEYKANIEINTAEGEVLKYTGKIITRARIGFVQIQSVRRSKFGVGRTCFYKTIDTAKFQFRPSNESAPQMILAPYSPVWLSDPSVNFIEDWFNGMYRTIDKKTLKKENWDYFLFDCNKARGDGVGEKQELQAKVESALQDNTYKQFAAILKEQIIASAMLAEGFTIKVTPVNP